MGNLAEDIAVAKKMRDALYELERDIARKSQQMRPLTESDSRELISIQARANSIYQLTGRRADAAWPGERPFEFRRRLLNGLKAASDKWANVNLDTVDDVFLDNIEDDIFTAARADARSPRNMKSGEVREIIRRDETTGHAVTEFFGGEDTHFVRQFSRAPRRAILRTWNQYEQIARDNARHYPPRETNSRLRWA